MKLRYLRIAFSAGCGMLCLLLVALWVRSYRTTDVVMRRISSGDSLSVGSRQGYLWVATTNFDIRPKTKTWYRYQYDTPSEPDHRSGQVVEFGRMVQLDRWGQGYFTLRVAHWVLGLAIASCAALPWLPWSPRFSLRTLLIAMTLVAVGLGLLIANLR